MERDAIASGTANNDLIEAGILSALELAILTRREDGLFRLHGAVPGWLDAILPLQTDRDAVDVGQVFPLLELFLADCGESVEKGKRIQSDVWTEQGRDGVERELQAVALNIGGQFVLAIEWPMATIQERRLAMQRAHDVQLQAEKIERMSRELARLNAELQVRNEEVEEATRAKSAFLAAMSHEIRTPMNAIIGMADSLQQSGLNEEQKKYVNVLQGAGENLLALINDILDLSKVEAGKVELESVEFDLNEVVSQAAAIVQVRAKVKDLNIRQQIGEHVPTGLIGDPNRLRQVIINLLGNATKFTERGEMGVSVGVDSEGETGSLHFVVWDTGIGIPADKVETIFESFSQADSSTTRKYGGTGLGLSISRQLIALFRGRIWVESEVGVGSRFHFTAKFGLQPNPWRSRPMEGAHHGPAQAEEAQPQPTTGESLPVGLRILLADDSEDNRFVILTYLKGSGCVIEIAENGRIAVEKFAAGRYDLVLMDVEMPEMDGYTAVEKIRGTQPNGRTTPVLALTAHAFKEAMEKSMRAGFTGHLTKPIRRATLLDAIRKYAPAAPSGGKPVATVVAVDPSLSDLVPAFLDKRRQDGPRLAESLSAGDYDTVRKIGHNLKGTGASYGFGFITEVGARIEEAAKLRDAATISNKIEELTNYLSSVEWVTSEDSAEV